MKKNNMLEYLDKQLEKELKEYDFAIDWHTRTHTVEVMVVLYAHNNQHVKVKDLNGIQSEEEIIEFEDMILLYPEDKPVENIENYLAVIPYEGKKGMKKGTIEAIATYMSQVVEQGESDLMDFLQLQKFETELTEFMKNEPSEEELQAFLIEKQTGTTIMDFLQEEDENVFTLKWDDAAFHTLENTLLERSQGTTLYPYPRY